MPDVARDPAILKRKRLRQVILAVLAGIVVVVVSVALARMEPAAPTVERATVLEDTVKRGSIVRQVRGLGTLVPEDTRWLPATTDGRVERILLRPGARVQADSVILELSNPQVEQEALDARLALQSALAALDNLRVQLQNELLTQQAAAAALEAEAQQAKMEADAERAAGQGAARLGADPAAVAAARRHAEAARRDRGQAPGRGARAGSRRGSACSRPRWTRRARYPVCGTSGWRS